MTDKRLSFEQSRLEHCIRLFKEENSRRETFERTAQYYLTFLTAFLAALFLKVDFLQTLSQLLAIKKVPMAVPWIVYLSIAAMLVAILVALICIFECIRVRRYKREFPSEPALRLFAADSMYVGGADTAEFLKVTAMTYVAAIEDNFDITECKSALLPTCQQETNRKIQLSVYREVDYDVYLTVARRLAT